MEFIAYNTTLDIQTLVKAAQNDRARQISETNEKFVENKRQLLPYVLKYLHYLTDLHNSVVIKSCYADENYRTNIRIMRLDDKMLDISKVIQDYTKDFYFENNGATYSCNMFRPVICREVPIIWLNSRHGCYVNNSSLEYSMTAGGLGLVYADSVEHFIQLLTTKWINSERG